MLSMLLLMLACDGEPAATSAEDDQAPAAASAEASTDEWTAYGQPLSEGEMISAATLLQSPDRYVDQTVRVAGKVTDVCQKAGCWMVITDDTTTMRVLMKDHAFMVDKGGKGADCQVEGRVIAKQVDPDFVKHMEEESTDTTNMPEKQAQDNVVYQLIATGVRMKPSAG
ncbi:MAG: DUF4920 domain-containing protein [Myxococcota bacterium]